MIQLTGVPGSGFNNTANANALHTLIVNSPTSSLVRIVPNRLIISASEIMGSHDPAKSMSCETLSHNDTPQRIHNTHCLREFPHTTLGHHRVIPPVDLSNLPQLGVCDGSSSHSEVSRQRNGVIVPQSELLSSLVLQVENEFGVFSVLASEDVFSFENWGIEATAAVEVEDVLDRLFYVFTTEHLCRTIVSCALTIGHVPVNNEGCGG